MKSFTAVEKKRKFTQYEKLNNIVTTANTVFNVGC